MKKLVVQLLLGLLALASARADTALKITGQNNACWNGLVLYQNPPVMSASFTLPGASGSGMLASAMPNGPDNVNPYGPPPPGLNFYDYTIDVSTMSAPANHCVRLLIHFGAAQGCSLGSVFGSPTAIQSATLAPFGDITFVFAGGCLSPGQAAISFSMISDAAPKTNFVTVIDDYTDPASGQTNETRINVPAIVPDVPPNPPPWLFAQPRTFPYAYFQGDMTIFNSNNPAPPLTNVLPTGSYDFTVQAVDFPTNGLGVSQTITQSVHVVNGLFNVPLTFEPVSLGDGSARWLSIGVRTSSVPAVPFTPLNPALPLAPAPQALYAFRAGVVADLAPGQAVTSLNGLTDAVTLQSGPGIILGTNGNTLTVTTQPGMVSDRNLKTDFTAVDPRNILARLVTLPIQSWRFTNEVAGVRHLGPMAQDFKAAFALGDDDKMIGFVDEQGVALAAIQALNQKLNERDSEIQQLSQSVAQLEALVAELVKATSK